MCSLPHLRVCTPAGMIENLHLLAIPLFENKAATTLFSLCVRLLDVVDAHWRTRLISIGSDGENTMTGRLSGVQTLFEQAVAYPIVRVWCGLHQLDLVAQKEYSALCDDKFVTVLTGLVSWLRWQQNLQTEMGSTCPKFVSTR